MNKWLKIGVPVLVAVLLVISAVSITIAVTNANSANQSTASYAPGYVSYSGEAKSATCPGCPGYGQTTTNDQTTGTNPVYVPQGKQGSCCAAASQGSTTGQAYRGGCCGIR